MGVVVAEVAMVLAPAAVGSADPCTLMVALVGLCPADIVAMDRCEAEAVVLACARARAALDARQSLAMDTLASRVDEDLQRRAQERRDEPGQEASHPEGTAGPTEAEGAHPGPDLHGFVASMLAPGLHCSTRTVQRRLEADRRLVCTVESTFQALWVGDLDRPRADSVVETAAGLDSSLWARFEALVLQTTVDPVTGEVSLVSEEVKRMSRSQLARRAARIARHLDLASHDRATRAARDCRTVVVRPDRHHPGLALWKAHLPSEISARVFAAVDALAGQYAHAHPGTGIDAHRADALADLVLGNAEVTTVVELVVPVLPVLPAPFSRDVAPTGGEGPLRELRPFTSMAVGSSEESRHDTLSWIIPGVVDDPRHGVLLPDAVAAQLADPDTVVRLARLDPDGSIVQDPTAYRPSASTRRRVRTRDGSCRFPGCATPAARTDIDHVVPHPYGPTEHTNLICLCRTHHLFKHHSGWSPTLAPDGTVTWTARDGRTWTTHPRPHDLRDELSLPDHPDPETGHQLRRGWYPGLPPGMSLADLVLAESQLPEDPPGPDDTTDTPDPPEDWQDLDQYPMTARATPADPQPDTASSCVLGDVRPTRPLSWLERHYEQLLAA